jgi:hypothetical protein
MAAIMAAAGSLGQLVPLRPALASTDVAVLADRLLGVHGDQTSASVIGKALLKEMPVRPDLDHVVRVLMHRLDLPLLHQSPLSPADLPPTDLRDRLKGKTSEDFRLGQTTKVQGWVLGETEAWLCSLAALRVG